MHNEFDDILLENIDFDIDNIISDQNPINLNYDQLKQYLNAIIDKNTIQFIYKSNCCLDKLEGNTFDGFRYLIDLDLSHNIITFLPRGVFDQLISMQKINLSHNLISEIEDCVFKNNTKLQTINLSNNLLTMVNKIPFENLPLLHKLDLSYNKIKILSENFLISKFLKELNLSNNQIIHLSDLGFWFLPNLIHLQFNNNKITYLNGSMFINSKNIEYLNFSNNYIQRLDKKTFSNLQNLKQVDFSNNLLTTLGRCFENKPFLKELNLLNNPIGKFWIRDLLISENIRTFKLTIEEPISLEKLQKLQQLSDLELHIKTTQTFLLDKLFLIGLNCLTIQKLYIVIQKGILDINYEISYYLNLEFLHIEFLEPNATLAIFNIEFHINRMPKLIHLALININRLMIVINRKIKQNNLTYLDLTGIDNVSVDFINNNFVMLEQLNLSFSQVESISQDLMKTLPNLKHLIMNNTNITVIVDNLFKNNNKLEVINFKNCKIHTIGENAFRNLMNLQLIDIRGNKQLRITQNLLSQISKSAIVYYD